MNEYDEFWLVWNPKTGYTKHRHQSVTIAKQEAERLAGEFKGDEFHVLRSVGKCLTPKPVVWIEAGQVPF